jgi:hypothetical protein
MKPFCCLRWRPLINPQETHGDADVILELLGLVASAETADGDTVVWGT